jgi:hypothetical protein
MRVLVSGRDHGGDPSGELNTHRVLFSHPPGPRGVPPRSLGRPPVGRRRSCTTPLARLLRRRKVDQAETSSRHPLGSRSRNRFQGRADPSDKCRRRAAGPGL